MFFLNFLKNKKQNNMKGITNDTDKIAVEIAEKLNELYGTITENNQETIKENKKYLYLKIKDQSTAKNCTITDKEKFIQRIKERTTTIGYELIIGWIIGEKSFDKWDDISRILVRIDKSDIIKVEFQNEILPEVFIETLGKIESLIKNKYNKKIEINHIIRDKSKTDREKFIYETTEEFKKQINEKTLDTITKEMFSEPYDINNICLPFMKKILELIVLVDNCDKFSAVNNVLEYTKDENKISSLIHKTNSSIDELLAVLNNSSKSTILNYIQERIQEYLNKINNDLSNLIENPGYHNISKDVFTFNGSYYEAEYVIFNNLKVNEFHIIGDQNALEEGLKIIDDINKKYKNIDYKKLCSELLVLDGYAEEWDEKVTSSDIAYKYLSDEVIEIVVLCNKKSLSIWFENQYNENDFDLYGGHSPRLDLYSDKDDKDVGLQ